MTYALIADIEEEFRKIKLDGTEDITNIQPFLDQADAEINLCLSNKYEVPIKGIESLKVLKRIEIAIVSARVAAKLDLKHFPNQESTIKQEFNKKDFANMAKEQLDDLKNEKITLIDATLLSSDFGMSSTLVDDCIVGEFEKGVDQW